MNLIFLVSLVISQNIGVDHRDNFIIPSRLGYANKIKLYHGFGIKMEFVETQTL